MRVHRRLGIYEGFFCCARYLCSMKACCGRDNPPRLSRTFVTVVIQEACFVRRGLTQSALAFALASASICTDFSAGDLAACDKVGKKVGNSRVAVKFLRRSTFSYRKMPRVCNGHENLGRAKDGMRAARLAQVTPECATFRNSGMSTSWHRRTPNE